MMNRIIIGHGIDPTVFKQELIKARAKYLECIDEVKKAKTSEVRGDLLKDFSMITGLCYFMKEETAIGDDSYGLLGDIIEHVFGVTTTYYYQLPTFLASTEKLVVSLEKRVELIDRIILLCLED